MSAEIIVFDLGKVIFDFDTNKLSALFARSSTKAYEHINNILHSHWEYFSNFEKGQISPKNFYVSIVNLLNLQITYKQFCSVWNNIFTPIKDIIDFIPLLSEKYNLAILSNTNILHYEFLQIQYPEVFKYFKNLHLSYLMNARKPEDIIYDKVIKFYNVEPDKIIFIDDIQINIDAAKKNGISAFKFESLEKLKCDLFSLGIKI